MAATTRRRHQNSGRWHAPADLRWGAVTIGGTALDPEGESAAFIVRVVARLWSPGSTTSATVHHGLPPTLTAPRPRTATRFKVFCDGRYCTVKRLPSAVEDGNLGLALFTPRWLPQRRATATATVPHPTCCVLRPARGTSCAPCTVAAHRDAQVGGKGAPVPATATAPKCSDRLSLPCGGRGIEGAMFSRPSR